MITILCAGSRGDYQPYIALAQQLKKLGKQVRITASKSFENFITPYDIDIYPISADLNTLEIDPELLKAAGSADNPIKMLLAFNKMKTYGMHMTAEYYQACAGSEMVIYHPGVTIAYFAAEQLGIPCVLASPFPLHTTKEYLSVVMYGRSRKNPFSVRMSYAMLQGMLWMTSSSSVKRFWKKRFHCLPKNFGKPYEKHTDAHHPAIIFCSNHIFKRPNDWNVHIHQEGYWFVEEASGFTPPSTLADFLKAGEKPLYFGFGSMSMTGNLEALGEIVVEALRRVNKRGIISGMGTPKNLTKNIYVIDAIPHTWLFEQVSAVCHHGGAGTSAAGFRAGVPSIIIPFSNDQFAWAHRAYELGIGSQPIPRKKLSVESLVKAINYALQDEITAKAAAIGKKITQEQGAKGTELLITILQSSSIGAEPYSTPSCS